MHIAQPFSAFLTHVLELQQFMINPKYCLLCCIPLYSGPRNQRMLPIWPQLGLWQTTQRYKSSESQNKIIMRFKKVQDGISVAVLSSFGAQILNLSFLPLHGSCNSFCVKSAEKMKCRLKMLHTYCKPKNSISNRSFEGKESETNQLRPEIRDVLC